MRTIAAFFNHSFFAAMMGDPQTYQRGVQAEMLIKDRLNGRDPNHVPPPKKGDGYILGATFIGVVLGGLAGFFIAMYGIGKEAIFLSIIVGILVGGFAGVWVGSYLKKRSERHDDFDQMNPIM